MDNFAAIFAINTVILHSNECKWNLLSFFCCLGWENGRGCLSPCVTFVKLGVLREPCGSEPGTGLFGFDLCRKGESQTKRKVEFYSLFAANMINSHKEPRRASRNYKPSPVQLFFSHIKLKQRRNAAVFQIVLTPSGSHPLSHQNVCHISFPKLSRQGKETSVCSLFQRKDLKRSRNKTCVLY